MPVKISKPAINLREELASLRNQGGLPKEDKLYLDGLVSNGNFGTSSDWTLDTNWEISNGELHANSTAQYTSARQTLKTTVGKTYKATVTCTSYTSGSFRLYVHDGNAYQESATFTSTGTYTVTWKARTSSDQIRVYSYGGTAVGTFDNVSVQEVGENLVTNGTFDYDLTGWTVVNPNGQTVEQTGGKLRLATTVGSDYIDANQLLTNTTSGKTYTLSLDYTKTSGSGFSLVINGVQTNHTASGHIVRTFVSDGSDFIQIKRMDASDSLFDNITVTEGSQPHHIIQSIPYGYDVKDVYIDGELAREGEAYDYEVKTDGINQWLKPSVEPTATTETVVIRVRK